MERRSKGRALRKRILIFGEGQKTEFNYFADMKRDGAVVHRDWAVIVKRASGGSALEVVRKAVNEKNDKMAPEDYYDEVWCVLDVEDHTHEAALADARKLASENNIELALSNPCFEVWLLAHFARVTRPFNSRDIEKELGKKLRKKYDKTATGVYAQVSDLTVTAIKNARKGREHHDGDIADCNSATEVYKLVERLRDGPGASPA